MALPGLKGVTCAASATLKGTVNCGLLEDKDGATGGEPNMLGATGHEWSHETIYVPWPHASLNAPPGSCGPTEVSQLCACFVGLHLLPVLAVCCPMLQIVTWGHGHGWMSPGLITTGEAAIGDFWSPCEASEALGSKLPSISLCVWSQICHLTFGSHTRV